MLGGITTRSICRGGTCGGGAGVLPTFFAPFCAVGGWNGCRLADRVAGGGRTKVPDLLASNLGSLRAQGGAQREPSTMKRVSLGFGLGTALLLGVFGCASEGIDGGKPDSDDTKGAPGGKFEAWGPADAPSIFNSALEYKLSALPANGAATNVPWASSYWPVYEDSINYKWAGPTSDSAAKKYEKAFGGTGVEDAVSKYHGIDA